MKTESWAIAIVFVGTLVGSFGGLLLKFVADEMSFSFWAIVRSKKILLAIGLYGISTLLYLWALKGGQLSILYPMVSLSYVWIAVLSKLYLKERIGMLKIGGVCLIIVGVVLIGLGN